MPPAGRNNNTRGFPYRPENGRHCVKRRTDKWDLVVLGGGTAGIVASKTAAGLGARVLLIEREKTGGDCLWTGCVPSKSILAAAHAASIALTSTNLGVTFSKPTINFLDVMNHVKSVIKTIAPQDSALSLEELGVTVIQGIAVFTSPKSISVNGSDISFRKAIIATGASPSVPPIPGLAESAYLTSDNIWELTELPKKLVVLGAGSIGSELGQAFSRLGSQVTLIDGAARILPREDEDASKILSHHLSAEGVSLFTSAKVKRIETDAAGKGQIIFDSLDELDYRVDFDRILISIGRSPRTSGFNLDKAQVELDDRKFVVMSPSLRTTNPNIWAAGDVTGHPQFTHVAGVHGSAAASNAILGISRKAELLIPRVTFTDPEIAAVGEVTNSTTRSLRVLQRSNADVDRAITDSQQSGFTKIVLDPKGRVVGGLSVGPRAGEVLAEITLAIRLGLKTRDIASTIHPYPTYGDGFWNLAIADVRDQLSSPKLKFALNSLRRFSRIKDLTLSRGN